MIPRPPGTFPPYPQLQASTMLPRSAVPGNMASVLLPSRIDLVFGSIPISDHQRLRSDDGSRSGRFGPGTAA